MSHFSYFCNLFGAGFIKKKVSFDVTYIWLITGWMLRLSCVIGGKTCFLFDGFAALVEDGGVTQ